MEWLVRADAAASGHDQDWSWLRCLPGPLVHPPGCIQVQAERGFGLSLSSWNDPVLLSSRCPEGHQGGRVSAWGFGETQRTKRPHNSSLVGPCIATGPFQMLRNAWSLMGSGPRGGVESKTQ